MKFRVPVAEAEVPDAPPTNVNLFKTYDWGKAISHLSKRLKIMRLLLNVSQDQLAITADVSQGAVSRIESGKCLNTPLISYVKVVGALCHELLGSGEDVSPEIRGILDVYHAAMPTIMDTSQFQVFSDPHIHTLLQHYRSLSPAGQHVFMTLLTPIADHLSKTMGK